MPVPSLIAAVEQRRLAEREALMQNVALIAPERMCGHAGCGAVLRVDNDSGLCPVHREKNRYLRVDFRGARRISRAATGGVTAANVASARPSVP